MDYRPLFAALAVALFISSSPAKSEAPTASEAASAASATSTKLYGEALPTGLPVLDLGSILKEPKKFAGKSGVITGHVRQACTKKGCWMELSASADPKAKSCRVKFKDYGFFVPLNSAGSKARLAATASIKVVSKAHVDHYEAEGGSFSDKNPDGTANEIQLVATGVELTR